jgi:hypothetical protein
MAFAGWEVTEHSFGTISTSTHSHWCRWFVQVFEIFFTPEILLSEHQVLVHNDAEDIYPNKARVEHLDTQKLHTKGAGSRSPWCFFWNWPTFAFNRTVDIASKGWTNVLSLSHTRALCVYPKQIMCCCVLAELGFTVTKLELDAQTGRNQFIMCKVHS